MTVDTEYSDSVSTGNVISQNPSAGTKVDSGTGVTIVVSLGKKPEEKVSVPDVTSNVTEANARQMISNAGLSPVSQYENSDTVPAGYVIRCSPGVGSSVSKGTTVTIVVSRGPAGGSTETPDDGDDTTDEEQ